MELDQLELNRYVNLLAHKIMGSSNKKILKKTQLIKHIKVSQYTAVMTICNQLHKSYMDNNYNSADVVIGDA